MTTIITGDTTAIDLPEDELTRVLADPNAWVGAMGPDALLFTALPAGAPFAGHRQLQGRWVMDHVVSGDRAAVGRAWRESRVHGCATASGEIVGGGRSTFHFFDRMAEHGCFVVVAIEEDGAVFATADFESRALRPRHCRVLRAESGRIIQVDGDAELVLGWTAEELIAEMPISLFHEDDHERIIDTWMATLADTKNGQRCRARFLRPDKTWMWLELTNHNHLDDDHDPRVECEMLDVSDEMAAHEAVRAREQLLHRLAEALPIGVLQLDRDQSVVYKNDHLGVVLGIDAAATADELFAGVHVDDQPVVQGAIGQGLDQGVDCDVAVRVTVDGVERIVRVITKAIVSDGGEASGLIVSVTDITDETNASRDLQRRATFDALTGCLNRPAILGRLEEALRGGGEGTAVLFLDLDGFKAINDQFGHSVGDDVLQLVADRLRTATRGHDDVGRLGGDEFLVVCHDITEEGAMKVADRIAQQVGRRSNDVRLNAPLRASVGVAWTIGSEDGETLVARADAAMYASKRHAAGEPQRWSR